MKTLAVVVALVVVGGASGAVKPKPWAWDARTAARQLGALELYGRESGTLTARCAGKGKAVAKRYVAFQCSTTWTPRGISSTPVTATAWVRVRPVGKGGACVSFVSMAKVPAVCLAKGARVGDRDDARNALRLELQRQSGSAYPYQGPSECLARGPGYFECYFGSGADDPASGTAWVLMSAVPRVVVTKAVG